VSCEHYAELISAHLDGELTREEAAQLQEHLAVCSDCQALEKRMRDLSSQMQSLPVAPPPPLRLPASRPRRARGWGWALAAAALFAIVLWRGGVAGRPGDRLTVCLGEHQQVATTVFRSPALHGSRAAGATNEFELHLDSSTRPASDMQLQVAYDFEGDGVEDRRELYGTFTTDAADGWQVYSHSAGLVSASGELRDLQGGIVSATLTNAPAHVKLRSGASRLLLPHQAR
jgi:hypothetical protein